MSIESDKRLEGPELATDEEYQEASWHEEEWVKNKFIAWNKKNPGLTKFATRVMDAIDGGLRESAAPGPRENAVRNYQYDIKHPKPMLGIGIGPLGGMIVGIYKFAKGGETYEALKKKYKLD